MLKVNGTEREWTPGLTVAGLLERENYRKERVAVERNRDIIPRAEFDKVLLEDGDVLEVVSFMGGG